MSGKPIENYIQANTKALLLLLAVGHVLGFYVAPSRVCIPMIRGSSRIELLKALVSSHGVLKLGVASGLKLSKGACQPPRHD